MAKKRALLVLEDGRSFEGTAFGAEGEVFAEIVFNTSMTGYQEILTDPSYKGQMVVMTYPLIGNYGINDEDEESPQPQVAAFIVKELASLPSNWRKKESLENYLERFDIMGLEGLDTRALVLHIREKGAMRAGLSTETLDPDLLLEKTLQSPAMIGRDLVREVTPSTPYHFQPRAAGPQPDDYRIYKIVAYDFGIKRNILNMLSAKGCDITVVPATTTAREVEDLRPHAVLLSNGPGDPEALDYVIREVRSLLGKFPIFGICLGHQLLGLALGGKTYKLKFGHRGANHPVIDVETRKVEITVQNHGFCVDPDSLDSSKVQITHWNLNDRTVEGLRHMELPAFSVQYHPEASAGPHDSRYLFDRFRSMLEEHAGTI
jgi:carbamoyl-phosphate synthase small subunit